MSWRFEIIDRSLVRQQLHVDQRTGFHVIYARCLGLVELAGLSLVQGL